MTTVRIAHVEPRPGRQPDGGFRISSFLVVLADDLSGRALPVWLIGPEGHGLWRVFAPDAGPRVEAAEALTSRLLQAAGAAVTGVDIGELDAAMTSGPRRGRPEAQAPTSARIEFTGAGAGVPRQMQAPLGYALALAAAFGAPVRVADQVMDSLAVAARGEDLLGAFLGDGAPRPGERREPDIPRFDPRNLTFADGLAGWEFGGSFRDEQAHAADYACAAQAGIAAVASAVDKPGGFAALAQSVLAHEYAGRTVTFRAEVRTEGRRGRGRAAPARRHAGRADLAAEELDRAADGKQRLDGARDLGAGSRARGHGAVRRLPARPRPHRAPQSPADLHPAAGNRARQPRTPALGAAELVLPVRPGGVAVADERSPGIEAGLRVAPHPA